MSDLTGPMKLWTVIAFCEDLRLDEPKGTGDIKADGGVCHLAAQAIDPEGRVQIDPTDVVEAFAGRPVKQVYRLVHNWILKEETLWKRRELVENVARDGVRGDKKRVQT